MNIRLQTLILIFLILASFSLTRTNRFSLSKNSQTDDNSIALKPQSESVTPSNFAFQKASFSAVSPVVEVKRGPERIWEVLDPKISAVAAMVQSLDDNFPFYNFNTYKTWPMASLTKLLTAILVIDEIGLNKKIMVSERAVAVEGEAGGLESGEIYTSGDLLKVMLLTSSNDAAAAFEDYVGGKDEFLKLLNKKAEELGMTQTLLHDGSGLSDLNQSTASDLLRLTKYILEHEPQIFSWARLQQFLVQPINDGKTRTIYNINPFVSDSNFLGGKTGTSEEAGENLLAIFTLKNHRVALILLGSSNRINDVKILLDWIEKAYIF